MYRLSPYFSLDKDVESTSQTIKQASAQDLPNYNDFPYSGQKSDSMLDNKSDNSDEQDSPNQCESLKNVKRVFERREQLAKLKDLTYLCDKEEPIMILTESLKSNLAELRPHIPSDRGLCLEQNPHRKFKTLLLTLKRPSPAIN